MADPDLQIREGPGHPDPEISGGAVIQTLRYRGGGHPDPEISGGGLKNNFFPPFGSRVARVFD